LSSKQLRLTESLILYSQELSAKIPKIAQKWTLQNARLRKILNKKKVLQKLSNKKHRQREKIDKEKDRVGKIEDLVFNEKKDLLEIKKKVEGLGVKCKDYGVIERVLNDLEIKRVRTLDRITTFSRYKDLSREQLMTIQSNAKKIEKLQDRIEIRREEVLVSKEDVQFHCCCIQKGIENIRNDLKSFMDLKGVRDKSFKKEILTLRERFQSIYRDNQAKRQHLKNFKDKIEANLALLRLENKHVDNRRKKIKEVSEWIKNQQNLIKTSKAFVLK
jgi:hypothetical protein